ncbi:hypothetical protein Daus18300_012647 [Diaporthe australafricana]|uniref:Oxysterol-binding protein n=1 Tax=Diaporthe australafricana TaxID=127596 RepID=A0ABR3W1W6_9PEZI
MGTFLRVRDFFKFLKSVKGDLANITGPPFFLAPSSVTEVGSCWVERPSLFIAPALEEDPEIRALLVLKWILVSLKAQFYVGQVPGHGIKKPLNAFLGEIFRANWSDDKGTASLVSEQVSHHPPITAVYMWNDEHEIRGEGYSRVEMTFSGSVNIRQIGHAMLHLDKFEEHYLIPLPSCTTHGFLSGKLYPEINGTYHIVSSSGFTSEMKFHGPGLFGGNHVNQFHATMYRTDDVEKKALYVISGSWSDKFTIYKGNNNDVIEVWDHSKMKETTAEACCEPIDKQDPWETRKAWQGVLEALKSGELGTAVDEKSKLENSQRLMRSEEKKKGLEWEPLLFSQLQGGYEIFDRLASATKWELEADKTKGVWKVNSEKVRELKHPFRPGISPFGHVEGVRDELHAT